MAELPFFVMMSIIAVLFIYNRAKIGYFEQKSIILINSAVSFKRYRASKEIVRIN